MTNTTEITKNTEEVKIIEQKRYGALYKESGNTYISISIPRNDTQLFALCGEILSKTQKRVRDVKLPLRLYSVALPIGMNPPRIVYQVKGNNGKKTFEDLYELFLESVLDSSFSDPVKFITIQKEAAEFNLKMMNISKEMQKAKTS